MKNQALTTTLAVLLAVSLSAIVALVVSSEVIGGAQTAIVEAPAAVQVNSPAADTQAPVTPAAPVVATPTVPPAPATPEAPAEQPTDDTEAPDAPATPTDDEPGDDTPAEDPVAPDTPDAPAEDDDPQSEDPEAPDTPEGPADDDEPQTGEPPCAGTIIDGECVPISILCTLGYTQVGGDCVFVGCPNGFKLDGDFCVPLGLTTACPEGQTLVGQLCLLVLDPVVVQPLCGVGEKLVDGNCVSVCPPQTMWVGGFCLPEFDFDFDTPVLPDLDFIAANGS